MMRIIRRISLIWFLLMLPSCSQVIFAGTVSRYFDYSPGDSVTDVNLDGNFNNIINVLNGGLTNDNADVANGYRFIQILGTLPAAGNQGRVVFQQSDNTLYFDTGSAWRAVVTPSSNAVQGDTVYFGGTTWDILSKNTTATRYLSNTGASNNPAWAQVNIANGLTIASQATGDLIYGSSASAWARLGIGSSGQKLTVSGGLPAWGAGSNIQVFTSSDTFTAPTGVTKVYVTMCGGGGGGGAEQDGGVGGGGGGGGACIVNVPYTVTPSSGYSVVIGGGGNGGTTAAANGAVGTASTFDGMLSASGGNFGLGNGTGGAAKGGTEAGGTPTAGAIVSHISGAGGSGDGTNGGGGGGSTLGAGATGGAQNGSGSNATANTGGGGGGGGQSAGGGPVGAGGNGGSGICIVMY